MGDEMQENTASTEVYEGLTVKARNMPGDLEFGNMKGYLGPDAIAAAAAYFQAKRDEELGRWRSPLEPDFVVYPARTSSGGVLEGIRVWDERTGVSRRYADAAGVDGKGGTHDEVARAYFEAHPVLKPWEDAKQDEVWLLTVDGAQMPWGVGGGRFGQYSEHAYHAIYIRNNPRITAGRRIWPVDETAPSELHASSSQAGLASIRGGL